MRSIFKNKRLTEIEIQQLQKQIEKGDIVPNTGDTMSEMSCGGSIGTEIVTEQCCDLEDYTGNKPENHIENAIYQRLMK